MGATPQSQLDSLRALNAHVEAMQGMCLRYLEPAAYAALSGMIAGAKGDAPMRDKLFIADMIWMLDGPEQREAQEAARLALRNGADELLGEVERLRGALAIAAKRFREYERLHLAKGTHEGNLKADNNADLAEMCEAALHPKETADGR